MGRDGLVDRVGWLAGDRLIVVYWLPTTHVEVIGLDGTVHSSFHPDADVRSGTLRGDRLYLGTDDGIVSTALDGSDPRPFPLTIARVRDVVAVAGGPNAAPQPTPTVPPPATPSTHRLPRRRRRCARHERPTEPETSPPAAADDEDGSGGSSGGVPAVGVIGAEPPRGADRRGARPREATERCRCSAMIDGVATSTVGCCLERHTPRISTDVTETLVQSDHRPSPPCVRLDPLVRPSTTGLRRGGEQRRSTTVITARVNKRSRGRRRGHAPATRRSRTQWVWRIRTRDSVGHRWLRLIGPDGHPPSERPGRWTAQLPARTRRSRPVGRLLRRAVSSQGWR